MASDIGTQNQIIPTNMQTQSDLFGHLPGEIRNAIFRLALIQSEDEKDAYPEDSYWYRPGFSGPRKSSSTLLRTCKLAYVEGQKVFLDELEWAFWFDRGPKGRSGNLACIRFFRDLQPEAVQKLSKVRFFTQMYWLEDGNNIGYIMRQKKFRPTSLTVTIRYSDWWHWENNEPLSMKQNWLKMFMGSVGLRELKVEYETISWKRAEMMKIIETNKKFKLAIRGDHGHLSAEHTKLSEWKWSGPSKLGGQTWNHHGKADTIEYVVITDTWKYIEDTGTRPSDIKAFEEAEAQAGHESDRMLFNYGMVYDGYGWHTDSEGYNWHTDSEGYNWHTGSEGYNWHTGSEEEEYDIFEEEAEDLLDGLFEATTEEVLVTDENTDGNEGSPSQLIVRLPTAFSAPRPTDEHN